MLLERDQFAPCKTDSTPSYSRPLQTASRHSPVTLLTASRLRPSDAASGVTSRSLAASSRRLHLETEIIITTERRQFLKPLSHSSRPRLRDACKSKGF
ncbi:jg2823 [Pararge aegeria aegeria]|uniref:Jg2823 protein n=1 Tax=Pararge aegeria aegeria TaxID=348720 RepID=A0A8S4QIJ5_9NEOP|nr:jg2823 [Pararge aegeria aegeria]